MPEIPVYIWEDDHPSTKNCAICRKKTKPGEGPVCDRCRPHLIKKHKELQRKVTGGEYRRNPGIMVGDKVAYSSKWLRSTGQYTGDIPFARGIVIKLDDYGTKHPNKLVIAHVRWNTSEAPEKVNVKNLVRVDPERGIMEENPGLLTSKKERAKQYARLIVDYIKRKATPSELDELIKFINEKEKGLDNPLTRKEFENVMAEAKVHRKIPKEFYQGEASGMEDIAMQYKSNPPMTKIYNRILEVRASKEGMPHHCDAACKRAGHRYKHKFSSRACIYGLPDGSFLVK